jgi:N-acetylglucosamine kinase-like BadF-type ATPase
MARLSALAGELFSAASSSDRPDLVVATVAGADYPEDVRLLERAIASLSLGGDLIVLNDTYGALRAGSSAGWGVGLVCGQGINAGAISPDGKRDRFPGVGEYAGDWGGGGGIGREAISAAVRGSDGRGPRTALERSVPRFFGVKSPAQMTRDFYFERIAESRVNDLAPLVFAEAAAGDAVARSIIDRLADELVAMSGSLIRRLHMTQLDVEVVLAGGVFRNNDPAFYARLEAGISGVAAHAHTIKLDAPPVAGAVLLALDELSRRGRTEPPSSAAADRLRGALRKWDASLIRI